MNRAKSINRTKQNQILNTIFSKLKYTDLLYGYHEERGFSYIGDVKERIKNFKEAGWSPNDLRNKISQNKEQIKNNY